MECFVAGMTIRIRKKDVLKEFCPEMAVELKTTQFKETSGYIK